MTIGDWLTEAANWVFLFLAVPTLVASLMVVTSRNVVRAVLYLVITLAGSAALFLMLGGDFMHHRRGLLGFLRGDMPCDRLRLPTPR